MKRFKNILYIVESETSLEDSVVEKVISLARINNAAVTVVRVIENGPFEQLSRTFFHKGQQLTSLVIDQAQERYRNFCFRRQMEMVSRSLPRFCKAQAFLLSSGK